MFLGNSISPRCPYSETCIHFNPSSRHSDPADNWKYADRSRDAVYSR